MMADPRIKCHRIRRRFPQGAFHKRYARCGYPPGTRCENAVGRRHEFPPSSRSARASRLSPRPDLRLPRGGSRKKHPRRGHQPGAQLSPPGPGIGRQWVAHAQRPMLTRRHWPDKGGFYSAYEERIHVARTGDWDDKRAPNTRCRGERSNVPTMQAPPATTSIGVVLLSIHTIDSAIDENPKLPELFHSLPLDLVRW
jgi:hypothetical protein